MLEDNSQSSEYKVLVKRIEDLQKTKTALHQEIIKNQIEYEQRIHEVKIFNSLTYLKYIYLTNLKLIKNTIKFIFLYFYLVFKSVHTK